MPDELRERDYRRVANELARAPHGPKLAVGADPVLSHAYLPDVKPLETTVVPLPLETGSTSALVIFDVLERVPSVRAFFSDVSRVLAPGGLLIVSEPYMGPLSYPLYKLGSEAPIQLFADPLRHSTESATGTNQASATLLFGPRRASFERMFPELRIDKVERTAGPEASREESSSQPSKLVRRLAAVESLLPKAALALLGFRMMAVLQKR